jgi:hypothetical protein
MTRTISTTQEPVTRFNEIFYETTTKQTNASSSSGSYTLSFASTTDFTVPTQDFPGDLIGGTNIQNGTRVIEKSATSIILSKPITGAISSGDDVTLYSSIKGADGGPQGFSLIEGSGITLSASTSDAGVPTITLASTASGADGMGSGFVLEDNAGTEVTIDENKEVKILDGGGIDATWTDTTTGSDLDPYDLTFTLDLNSLNPAEVDVAADSIAIIDANATNATRKESIVDLATGMAGDGLTATSGVFSVDADQSGQITAVGNLTGLTVDGTTISLDATTSLNIDNSNTTNGITIGTATSGVPITIGHGISEVTFGDNVTITGNLTVNGEQTVINSTAIVAEDKSMVLGIAGGMVDATYARSGAVVTVTSNSHGFANGEYVYVSNMGNSIADGVYTVSSVATNTFVLDGHGTSGTVGAGATMQHSSANVTEGTADGSGIFAPGTSLHSIQYDSSNGWSISDDLDLASGKHLSINGTTIISGDPAATPTPTGTLGAGIVASSLTSVGVLDGGSITSNFGTIDTGASAISTTGTLTGGSIVGTSLDVSGNIEGTGTLSLNNGSNTITAAELNVLDGVTAGTVTASKALVVDASRDIGDLGDLTATGALEADGLQLTGGANSAADSTTVVAIMDVSEATNQSWTASTAYDIANYAFGTYRTAKFIVQVSDGTDTDCMEVLVTYEGASAPTDSTNIFLTTYAYITTADSDLGTIDAVKGTSTIDLQFTPTSNGTYSYSVVNTLLIK